MKEHILVYGCGGFYKQYEEQINNLFFIDVFIDNNKNGQYAGKDIIKKEAMKEYTSPKVLIMIHSIQQCIDIAKELINVYYIDSKNILLGHSFFGKYAKEYDFIELDSEGKISLRKNNIILKVSSEDEFHNAHEVLIDENYRYYINNNKRDIVIDVGMNIGDATLYFLNNEKVKKVYAYEPFKVTYDTANENLKEFLKNSNRLEIFQFGLSGDSESREIKYNLDMSCGQSTISETREIAYKFYKENQLISVNNEVVECIQVRKSSEIIGEIIEKHPEENIVLKIDCEGEEYSIFEDLENNDILEKIDFIMLEWHYKGNEILLNVFERAGFSYWCSNKNENMGVIYAYKQ